MKEHHIQTSIRAPFYELKSPDDDKLIYVLHGYGQLAQFFIQKFTPLQKLGYTIVAPEGLHRFYLEGTSGRVGASWMTKVNRELDILNYIQFLDSLHETYKQKDWKSITVLGFSQGVATAFRWIANGKIEPQEFLLCSGMIPPDVNLNETDSLFHKINLTYFTGTNDPYKTESAVTTFQERIRDSSLAITPIEFEGRHEVNIESILKALSS